jgi:putative transposase
MSVYSQIYIQTVFAVKGRESLIESSWDEQLYRYITGIVQNKGQKMLAVNGVQNHIHFLIGMKPACCLSDLVREIKKSSTGFINENKFSKARFSWQEGFGAFSYAHSQLDSVAKYVMNQKLHHREMTFKEEYLNFLEEFEISHDERYLFDWLE